MARSSSLALVLATALLAACGGGGGSSAPVPGGSPAGLSSGLSAQDAAQSGSDAAFAPLDTGEADAGALTISGVSPSGGVRAARAAQSLAHPCKNRTTRTVTVNPDGSVTIETIRYYDDACAQPERDAVAVYASAGGTLTVARTVTSFNKAHLQLGVRKTNSALTGTTGNGSLVITSAFYPGTSTSPMAQYGHSASINASAYAATTGRIANDAKPSINASFGHQAATNATIATDPSNNVTFTGTHEGASFKAALNGLTLSSAPPFVVSGGTQIGASSLRGSVTYDADGNLSAVSLTGTLAGGNTLVVTSAKDAQGALTVSGTISSPAGVTVATFVTDASGNGVLTLADGTQVPIVDWHVIW